MDSKPTNDGVRNKRHPLDAAELGGADMAKAEGSRSRSKKAKTSEPPAQVKVRAAAAAGVAAATNGVELSPEERHRLIAEAAYYRAEQRHFLGGDPVQDWLAAEVDVAIRLADPAAHDGKSTPG